MHSVRMSIVLIVYRQSDAVRMVFERLCNQEVARLLECIVVVPSSLQADWIRAALKGLGGCRLVPLRRLESGGNAKAAGVAAATTPLVAFLEDHSYPDRYWASSLLRAHESGNYAAVGPVILNANPATSASWGCFLVYYGQYMRAKREPDLKHLPANHSCYRREVLREYGPRLAQFLEAEILLHRDLLTRGYRLYQEPAARSYHLNHSRLAPTLREYFWASRVFASERASWWRWTRRVMYGLGSPLLPMIRSMRLFGDARDGNISKKTIARASLPVLLTLVAGAAGEMIGYLAGRGGARRRLLKFECERDEVFSRQDLEAADVRADS
jgi:hypothetical protein